MSGNRMSKLSAGLLVLMMALGVLIVLPGPTEVQALGTSNIYVPVVSGGIPVTGATVTLTNVHTGEVIPANPSSGLYLASNAPAGYYRVDVIASGYYNAIDAREFPFYGTSSYTVSPQISLTRFGDPIYQWNVTVSPALQGVIISFYNATARQIVASGVTNSQGYVILNMFRAGAAADMYLVSQMTGYTTNATPVTVTSDSSQTVTLSPAAVVSGMVTDWENTPASGVVGYLLNTDTSKPWITRLMKSSGLDPYFVFNAAPGTYLFCVDAYGLAATPVQQITVPAGGYDFGVVQLQNQTQRTEQTSITLASDWSSFSLSMATTLSYDEALPGLNYSDIGSLRMQIDLNTATPDGNLDINEVAAITAKVRRWGPEELTTGRLLTVNQTLYRNGTCSSFNFGIATGTVQGSTSGVDYSYACSYSALGSVQPASPKYRVNATARLDTPSVHFRYGIALPTGYELVLNVTDPDLSVYGYLALTVESSQATGYYEVSQLWVEASVAPIPKGAVDSSPTSYVLKNETGVVLKYIVRVGANATFNAGDSSDPNGNPLTYTWSFDDGSGDVTTQNKTVVHNYTTAASLRTVGLTVTDVAGLTNSTQLSVVCDGLDPNPVISAKNKTVNVTDNSISLDQGAVLIVNATSSTDDVATVGDGLGVINWVEFHYGDGNTSGRIPWTQSEQNVTHVYANAGTYNLTLNVTDVVGHWKNTTLLVKVNDTTAPTVTFSVSNATGGANLIENTTLWFNANTTYDNLDNYTLLKFSWYFGDGSWLNLTGAEGGNYVSHNYTRVGTFHVALNVTDLAGNYKKTPKTINVIPGPRPNLRIDRIYFSPGNWTEGQQGYILVNMTNTGSRPGSNVVVTFILVRDDGTEKVLGTSSVMYNATTGLQVQTVEVGGKIQVKFPYTFGTQGGYKIKVNATCENQLVVSKATAPELTVKQAGWKKPLLYGGVAAVIILVPLAIYLSRRWTKRERKGPRREKKSGAEQE